jgi:hypothetical protein
MLRKTDGEYLLAMLPGGKSTDFERFASIANANSVTLAPCDEAMSVAGCSVGCVHPLGNPTNLKTYSDKRLLQNECVSSTLDGTQKASKSTFGTNKTRQSCYRLVLQSKLVALR